MDITALSSVLVLAVVVLMEDQFSLGNEGGAGTVGAESFLLASWIFLGGPPLALPHVVLDLVQQDLMADIIGAGQHLLLGHQSSPVHSNSVGAR